MIRPIEMQMILPRSESVGNMQQNEMQHAVTVNNNAATEVLKNEQRLSETIVKKEEKQFDTFQYDAKEEGNGNYKNTNKRKKGSKTSQPEKSSSHLDVTKQENRQDVQPRIDIQI